MPFGAHTTAIDLMALWWDENGYHKTIRLFDSFVVFYYKINEGDGSNAMKHSDKPPVYSQVAFDIAAKIAVGELKEGDRFSGRSLMSSQYGVSPETIRRALGHLSYLGIVAIKNNSGSTVLSQQRAAEYVEQYQANRDLLALKAKLRNLVAQRDALNAEINTTFLQISDLWERFHSSDRFRTYEFHIRPSTAAAGKTIGQLQFRQRTGATIVAVRKGGAVQLSPGPQTVLDCGDTLVVACELAQGDQVTQLLGQPDSPDADSK